MHDIVLFIQQHLALSSAILAILFILVIIEFIKGKQIEKRLTSQQVTTLINHQNAVVVDTRTPDAFATGHIVGSISLPQNDLEKNTKKIEKMIAQPIVVVCATGTASEKCAALLAKKGFNVHTLKGGLKTWQQDGMPLVKD